MSSQAPNKFHSVALLGLLFGTLLLVIRALFVARLNIHWDEFFYLSQIFDLQAGRLADPLQTFHTRLFAPLTALPGEEPDLIVAGRVLMYCCSLLSLTLFCRQSAKRASSVQTILAVVLWLSLMETILHANSFRADGLCLALVTTALSLFSLGPISAGLGTVLLGFSLLCSLKTVLILAVCLPMFWTEQWRRRFSSGRAALLIFCTLGVFLCGYLLHKQQIVSREDIGLTSTQGPLLGMLLTKAREFLIPSELPRGFKTLAFSLCAQPIVYILGMSVLLFRLRTPARFQRWETWTILLLLGILLFYRNSFSYFLPCISFPICLIVARSIPESLSMKGIRAIMAIVALQGLSTVFLWWPYTMENQRNLIHEVHQRFPEPVPYIDRCGMISSFPKVGPFLSSLVMERYREKHLPIYTQVVASSPVAFLLKNSPVFQSGGGLLPEDERFLESQFCSTEIPNVFVPSTSSKKKGSDLSSVSRPLFAPY